MLSDEYAERYAELENIFRTLSRPGTRAVFREVLDFKAGPVLRIAYLLRKSPELVLAHLYELEEIGLVVRLDSAGGDPFEAYVRLSFKAITIQKQLNEILDEY